MNSVFVLGFLVCCAIAIAKANDEVCAQPPDSGLCKASIPQFFYNPDINDCGKFIYGGCGGNNNRFDNIEDCQDYCGVSGDDDDGDDDSEDTTVDYADDDDSDVAVAPDDAVQA